jgi:diguanylate cyclase (GGDEF)-like protein
MSGVSIGQPGVLWLDVVSDALIALAYFSIPVLIAISLYRRRDTPYISTFVMFGVFIALGGVTHVMTIVNVWHPIYWVDGFVKVATAGVSLLTAFTLAPILPKLIKLPNPILDGLTSLPNRLLFVDRLQLAMARMKRENRDMLAVLFVDLDGFKRVNDSLGNDLGNQLLVRVAKRLNRTVRTADTVARFGGDDFVLLLERIEGPLYAKAIARRIISELQRPFPFGEVNVQISASIGIVISDGSESPEDLIAAADSAMYRAKQNERGTFEMYDKSWQPAAVAN